ncbi:MULTISPECIES: HNH endonuclease [Enterobacter]|uniref:HNH endonuclease n=1 Tax=Enterobacteriaceae TaxID=543 RepID=UPI00207323E3|nr:MULTISPECIES: HNH endonuclease signature motif containing protein [Enterobacter]HCB2355492.1 HNH endonuclease [Escherichia coli]HDT2137302.1 HNH endonuclease [Enterobacter roggenkampii]MDC7948792.1 HNH endonuclease [Enterobacter kobei]MDV0895314.1 HNH endonuclease signature motif containing protein [Enterobacter cloacae]MDV0967669.1 HNH endonuclease signature motif containing protein [Enterobacter cloacae]
MARQFSTQKRLSVFTKTSGKCAYCGNTLSIESMHIDHIKPKKRGGNNDLGNLNGSCRPCNTAKGDRDLDDYRLHMMIKKSEFSGVITFKQWQDLNERGVLINLPTHLFHFEVSSL